MSGVVKLPAVVVLLSVFFFGAIFGIWGIFFAVPLSSFIKSIMDQPDSNIKGLILSIRPEEETGFDEWLEETIAMNVAGYRRILHVMPDELSQTPVFRNNVKKIGAAGKPFDICYLPTQLSVAYDFAKNCDEMNLVLNHLFGFLSLL